MKNLKNNSLALLALVIAAISLTLMSFNQINFSTKNIQSSVFFQYSPPATNPYSEANVKNTENWLKVDEGCLTPGDDAACTISVLMANTTGGLGLEIDPSKVSINVQEESPNVHSVTSPSSSTDGYTNPINRSIP